MITTLNICVGVLNYSFEMNDIERIIYDNQSVCIDVICNHSKQRGTHIILDVNKEIMIELPGVRGNFISLHYDPMFDSFKDYLINLNKALDEEFNKYKVWK